MKIIKYTEPVSIPIPTKVQQQEEFQLGKWATNHSEIHENKWEKYEDS